MSVSRPLLLALGDLFALVAFGAIGLVSHEKSFDVTPVLRSIVPFAAAWLLLSPFAGAYSDEALAGRKPIAEIALTWIPAGIIALIARAAIFDRHLFNAFFVIALIGDGIFITGWRALYSRWAGSNTVQT